MTLGNPLSLIILHRESPIMLLLLLPYLHRRILAIQMPRSRSQMIPRLNYQSSSVVAAITVVLRILLPGGVAILLPGKWSVPSLTSRRNIANADISSFATNVAYLKGRIAKLVLTSSPIEDKALAMVVTHTKVLQFLWVLVRMEELCLPCIIPTIQRPIILSIRNRSNHHQCLRRLHRCHLVQCTIVFVIHPRSKIPKPTLIITITFLLWILRSADPVLDCPQLRPKQQRRLSWTTPLSYLSCNNSPLTLIPSFLVPIAAFSPVHFQYCVYSYVYNPFISTYFLP